MSNPDARPRWLRELDRLSTVKSQILLYGNTKDSLLYPADEENWEAGPLREALFAFYKNLGYKIVASYDIADGMVFADGMPGGDGSMSKAFSEAVSEVKKTQHKVDGPSARKTTDPLVHAIEEMRLCVSNRTHPTVLIFNNSSQSFAKPDLLSPDERQALMGLIKASQESRRVADSTGTKLLQNLLVVVCDKLADLPTWIFLGNPYTGSIEIELPRSADREKFFELYLGGLEGLDTKLLLELTDGMSYRDLMGIRAIAQRPEAPHGAKKLIDYFKFGVQESQWESLKLKDLANAEEVLGSRVLGQPAAVNAACDMLRRARLHLSGAQHSSPTKPRGVLFFAGPTGVGKTELAKSIANLVFGTDEACARFDMSEYGVQHSDQRLLGAPPGYVGYEAGGQLTNRVRSNPFSVLLF
ncbi:MAG: hypothetical protein QOJ65_771, partial [Fimbriimonadaceae bacterium]|nr:hypothetical protein [Fimbriimonadaceae bacterium]